MARDFPNLKPGDEIRGWHFNSIYAELRRWRRMKGVGLVDVDHADDPSTPPVITGHAAGGSVRIWMPTGIAAGTFGSPASKADVILAVRSGTGWTTTGGATVTLWNSDTTAVVGAKAGWAVPRGGNEYDLMVADC